MTRNLGVVVLALVNLYFTLENLAAGEAIIKPWATTILVLNVIVLLVCIGRYVTAPEEKPVPTFLRPLGATVLFSVLSVPYWFAVQVISFGLWWTAF